MAMFIVWLARVSLPKRHWKMSLVTFLIKFPVIRNGQVWLCQNELFSRMYFPGGSIQCRLWHWSEVIWIPQVRKLPARIVQKFLGRRLLCHPLSARRWKTCAPQDGQVKKHRLILTYFGLAHPIIPNLDQCFLAWGATSSTNPEVKPAGQQAEFRSVASMLALRLTCAAGPEHFEGMSSLWVGGFLQEGMVFLHVDSGQFYLSLGFVHAVVMLWQIDKVAESWHKL